MAKNELNDAKPFSTEWIAEQRELHRKSDSILDYWEARTESYNHFIPALDLIEQQRAALEALLQRGSIIRPHKAMSTGPTDGRAYFVGFDAGAADDQKCEHCGSSMHYVGRQIEGKYHAFVVCDSDPSHFYEF